MGFNGAPGHFQLFGNLRIVAALQQQIGDLLLPWTQPYGLVGHAVLRRGYFAQITITPGKLKSPPSAPFVGQPRRKKVWLV
jgi:hypothetical protein